MSRYVRFCALVLAMAFAQHAALAWGPTGHMVVAQIAYHRLTSKAREEADRLVRVATMPPGSAENSEFITAACWADDIRPLTHDYDTWHYKDSYFSDKPMDLPAEEDTDNAVWAIVEQTKILRSGADDATRARALRLILHLVGDIHQPLHAASRCTPDHPHGDRGGNDFAIVGARSLHSYWDGGLGYLANVVRPLDDAGRALIDALATECTTDNPDKARGWKTRDPDDWAYESSGIAKSMVYKVKEGTAPSPDYVKKGQTIVKKRLAWAGYRLAALLNDALK